jgi:thiol-disulfide isomerase/thioredoxin
MTSIADARGQILIVYVWASWCEPCRRSFPHYQTLADRHPNDVVLLAVAVDPREQRKERLYAFLTAMHAKGSAVWDPVFPTRWGLPLIPEVILIDRQGVVRWIMTGLNPDGSDATWIADKLDELRRENVR